MEITWQQARAKVNFAGWEDINYSKRVNAYFGEDGYISTKNAQYGGNYNPNEPTIYYFEPLTNNNSVV